MALSEICGLSLLLAELRDKPFHLVLERLAVFLLLLRTDIAAGSEDVAMALDWVELGRFAKSRNVLVILAFTPAVVRVCYLGDVSVLELASRPVDHDAQLARIDEQNLARPVAKTTVLPVLPPGTTDRRGIWVE